MATTALMTALRVATSRFDMDWGDEIAMQRGGQIRVRQRRPDLWRAHFSVEQMPWTEYRSIKGLIADLQGSRSTFLAWDPGRQRPKSDPLGTLITLPGNIKINSYNADYLRLSLKGLPATYQLNRGDMLGFVFGGNYALHEIRSPATITAAAGVTTEFYVSPAIRPGISIEAVVDLYQPVCEMLIVPGSMNWQEQSVSANFTFEALQVID